jgi:hypothetical protein
MLRVGADVFPAAAQFGSPWLQQMATLPMRSDIRSGIGFARRYDVAYRSLTGEA